MVWNFIWLDLWEFKLPTLANNGGQRKPRNSCLIYGLEIAGGGVEGRSLGLNHEPQALCTKGIHPHLKLGFDKFQRPVSHIGTQYVLLCKSKTISGNHVRRPNFDSNNGYWGKFKWPPWSMLELLGGRTQSTLENLVIMSFLNFLLCLPAPSLPNPGSHHQQLASCIR